MTTIAEHSATVLPFTRPYMHIPGDDSLRGATRAHGSNDGPLPDNVVVLARFAREARRSTGRFWRGGPPEGEAA